MAGWWDGIKAAWKVLPRLGDTDPYVRIQRLEDQLDAERERRREAEEEIRRRDAADEIAEQLVVDGLFYYLPGEDGDRDGPFCTRCWDADEELVRIHRFRKGRWRCPNCYVLRGQT